ncbi:MAG: hypothetical protein PHE77_00875 [Candidatus Pacebacteria bacterium]|nr:hypothetical protein [Candidatus Paceibacterota bacterium]
MEKIGKVILIGIVLIVIAAPLVFIVGHNAKGRIAKFTEQGIENVLGLNSLPVLDQAKDAVALSDQTTKEIQQMIENLVGTTTSEELSTSSEEFSELSPAFSTSSATTTN